MSERVSTNGKEGRLHNGTQVGDGSTHRENAYENGSSTSRRPQPEQQSDREPCTFCKQHFAQAIRAYGFGTAIKPACEPITVARKPFKGSVAQNVLKYGTGGINIDGCRVGAEERNNPQAGFIRRGRTDEEVFSDKDKNRPDGDVPVIGRFPANLILSYPENEYIIKDTITNEQKEKALNWINENTKHTMQNMQEANLPKTE
jgi:hypothetical protein